MDASDDDVELICGVLEGNLKEGKPREEEEGKRMANLVRDVHGWYPLPAV